MGNKEWYRFLMESPAGEGIVLVIYIVVSAALFLLLIQTWQHGRYVERENRYLAIQQTLLKQYYESLKSQISLTRKLRHDIANHMYTLQSLKEQGWSEAAMKYREYLEEQYERLKQSGYCPDLLLDALLSQKARQCREQGIAFDTELFTLSMPETEEMERIRLFSELIDYGIHKICEAGTESTPGRLYIGSEKNAGYTVVHCLLCPAARAVQKDKKAFKAINQEAERCGGFAKFTWMEESGELKIEIAVR